MTKLSAEVINYIPCRQPQQVGWGLGEVLGNLRRQDVGAEPPRKDSRRVSESLAQRLLPGYEILTQAISLGFNVISDLMSLSPDFLAAGTSNPDLVGDSLNRDTAARIPLSVQRQITEE